MTQLRVELQRDGQPLGTLPVGEIQAVLESRFLRPTDAFRMSETEPWKALAQFPKQPSTAPASLAGRIKVAVAKATRPAGQLISHVSAKTTGLKNAPGTALSKATEKVLGDYLPHLQEMTMESLARLQGAGHTALRDEEFLRKLFGAIYDSLPRPVYRFVTEQQFIDFCLRHRRRLLGAGEPQPD
jgi:hypothetical protein